MTDSLISESAIWLELTGGEQGWLKRCRAGVLGNPTAIAELDDDSPAARALQEADTRVLTQPTQKLEAPLISYDWHVATKIRGLALALTGLTHTTHGNDGTNGTDAVAAMIKHAEDARLQSAIHPHLPQDERLRRLGLDAPVEVQRVLGEVRAADSPARWFVELLALDLSGHLPGAVDQVTVPVVFAEATNRPISDGRRGPGAVGKLTLELLADGPGGLHPDPRLMCFLRADDDFIRSLHRAWQAAPTRLTGSCVLWRLQLDTHAGRPVADLAGGSLAAACAVALRDLGRHGHLRRATRLRTLDPHCAVTAGLADDASTLTSVNGLDHKTAAARTAGLRLVVADADRAAAHRTTHSQQAEIIGAPDLDRAERACRTNTNRNAHRVIAATLAVLLLLTTAAFAIDQRRNASDRQVEATREAAEATRSAAEATALRLANTSRDVGTSDRALALALAAESVKATQTPLLQAQAALLNARVAFQSTGGQQLPLQFNDRAGPDDVYQMAFSPNGNYLATHGNVAGLRLWDVRNGHPVRLDTGRSKLTADTEQEEMLRVAFSPDSKYFASADVRHKVRVWNLLSGKQEGRAFRGFGAAISPDGSLVAIRYYTYPTRNTYLINVKFYEISTGMQVGRALDGDIVAFSADSERAAMTRITNDEKTKVQVRDLRSGRLVSEHTEPAGFWVNYNGSARVPVELEANRGIRVWDVFSGKWEGRAFKKKQCPCDLTPDGQKVGLTDRQGYRLWDATSGEALGPSVDIDNLGIQALNPNSTRLATVSNNGTLRLWDLTRPGLKSIQLRGRPAALSADGSRLAIARAGGRYRLWNAITGGWSTWLSSSLRDVAALGPRGQLAASLGEKGFVLRDSVSGAKRSAPIRASRYDKVEISRDASVVAVANLSHVLIRRVATGQQLMLTRYDTYRYDVSLALSTDGRLVAIAFANGEGAGDRQNRSTVRIWDTKTGKPVGDSLVAPREYVYALAFSRDSNLLAAGTAEGTVRMWHLNTDDRNGSAFTGHESIVPSVAFSPDGTLLSSASWDGTARLWDTSRGVEIGRPLSIEGELSHEGAPTSVAFSSAGSFTTISYYGRVTRWGHLLDPDEACRKASQYVSTSQVAQYLSKREAACDYRP